MNDTNQSAGKTYSSRENSRYRGNAIGNAQNLLIRNILSNLGIERFNESDWIATKNYFSDRCAYCGIEAPLQMDHAIPINKDSLGEHRIGNIVPSCSECNRKKHGMDSREFLGENKEAIRKIEEYMKSRNYVPLGDNVKIKKILKIAHTDVADLATRYIEILNMLLPLDANDESDA